MPLKLPGVSSGSEMKIDENKAWKVFGWTGPEKVTSNPTVAIGGKATGEHEKEKPANSSE